MQWSCAYYDSLKLEDTYYSQIIPGIICQSLSKGCCAHHHLCKTGTVKTMLATTGYSDIMLPEYWNLLDTKYQLP